MATSIPASAEGEGRVYKAMQNGTSARAGYRRTMSSTSPVTVSVMPTEETTAVMGS